MSEPQPPCLDLRGGDSPVLPLLVRAALARLAPGQELEVWLSSPRWFRDLPLVVERSGDRCRRLPPSDQGYRLLLRRGGARPEPPRFSCPGS